VVYQVKAKVPSPELSCFPLNFAVNSNNSGWGVTAHYSKTSQTHRNWNTTLGHLFHVGLDPHISPNWFGAILSDFHWNTLLSTIWPLPHMNLFASSELSAPLPASSVVIFSSHSFFNLALGNGWLFLYRYKLRMNHSCIWRLLILHFWWQFVRIAWRLVPQLVTIANLFSLLWQPLYHRVFICKSKMKHKISKAINEWIEYS